MEISYLSLKDITAMYAGEIQSAVSHVVESGRYLCGRRDALQRYLTSVGIGTVIHYPIPPHGQKAYAHIDLKIDDASRALTDKLCSEELSLPCNPAMNDAEVDYLIKCLNNCNGE